MAPSTDELLGLQNLAIGYSLNSGVYQQEERVDMAMAPASLHLLEGAWHSKIHFKVSGSYVNLRNQ